MSRGWGLESVGGVAGEFVDEEHEDEAGDEGEAYEECWGGALFDGGVGGGWGGVGGAGAHGDVVVDGGEVFEVGGVGHDGREGIGVGATIKDAWVWYYGPWESAGGFVEGRVVEGARGEQCRCPCAVCVYWY